MNVYAAVHSAECIEGISAPCIPLFVGAARTSEPIPAGAQRDDSDPDNISWKNPYYSELTGLYWIWKHCKAERAGLVHYRRFFGSPTSSPENPTPITEAELEQLLETHDAVVAKREYFPNILAEDYDICHLSSDLFSLQSAIYEVSPEYYEMFRQVIHDNSLHPYNMIVAKKPVLDAYCAWLFAVLAAAERRIDPCHGRELYQTRVFGFLAERLMETFLRANRISFAECPISSPNPEALSLAQFRGQPQEVQPQYLRTFPSSNPPAPFIDPQYYLKIYPELADGYVEDPSSLEDHFWDFGLFERNQPAPYFSLERYLNANPYMRARCKEDVMECCLTLRDEHYAGRIVDGTPYPIHSVIGETVWEGVDFSPVYDYLFYTTRYHDVPPCHNETQVALQHFITVGLQEGRQGSVNFNVTDYQRLHPELVERFGDNTQEYYLHFLKQPRLGKRPRGAATYLSQDVFAPQPVKAPKPLAALEKALKRLTQH
ncbi:MAG: DUF4422 domain-containing protein [Coriobacteriia bacterium]|nr:DUF4422 domain-containing protein [Coriobacteriia bacterium]